MPAQRRTKVCLTLTTVVIAATWTAVIAGVVTPTNALWFSVFAAILGVFAARVRRHPELPDSVRLH